MIQRDNDYLKTFEMRVALCLFLFFAYTLATCPNTTVADPFDVSQYLGLWYEIATTPDEVNTFERNCYCTRANYTLENDGSVLVQNSCNHGSVSGPLYIANGTAIIEDPSQPAKLSVSFGSPVYAPYWIIINDDYENAVVWSCSSFGLFRVEFMWILSRQPTMSSSTYQMLTSEAQKKTGYDVSRLILSTQQGCSYPSST